MVWKTLVAQQRTNAQLNSHIARGHLGERRALYAQANHATTTRLGLKTQFTGKAFSPSLQRLTRQRERNHRANLIILLFTDMCLKITTNAEL